jgi:hypothetical protein
MLRKTGVNNTRTFTRIYVTVLSALSTLKVEFEIETLQPGKKLKVFRFQLDQSKLSGLTEHCRLSFSQRQD